MTMTDRANERTANERRADVARLVEAAAADQTPETLRSRIREVASQLPEQAGAAPGLVPGDRLGAYEITELLGAGGQAVVYSAKHVHLGREVAVKVPRRELAERLLREARMLARLDHPAVVHVIHVEPDGPVPHLVMECCDGGSLDELLQDNPDGLPLERVRQIAETVLDALGAAHDLGIVHRDLKPHNVLFDASGQVKVCDFGIGTTSLAGTLEGSLVTQGTVIAGTPLFMAPEQEDPRLLRGARLDGRADLYAFGKLVYMMLTGHRPRGFRPPSALRAGLDPSWDAYVLRLTEERPEDRFADAEEARAALPPADSLLSFLGTFFGLRGLRHVESGER
jgi:serine/threonine-protein kinase